MRKIIKNFALLVILSFAFSACSQNPENIRTSDLNTVCDYLDAILKVGNKAFKVKGQRALIDMSEDEKEELRKLESKMFELTEAADIRFTEANARECSNFEKARIMREWSNPFK